VRVIAIDQLDMGFSERTGTVRRLAQRIDDLSALTDAMEVTGPVVTVAHDWGGPISLGWAQRHVDQLAGIVLSNTAVHQPVGSRAPSLIRLVRTPGLLKTVCESTPTFVRGTMALSRPKPPRAVRAAYEAPYRSADRRSAIADFVEDIPLSADHPSHAALSGVAAGLNELQDVPALLLWGPSDPVFSDIYLHDFEARLPSAEVHRFVGASHLVPEDADVAAAVFRWLDSFGSDHVVVTMSVDHAPLWAAIDERSDSRDIAIVEMGADGPNTSVTFAQLDADIQRVAGGLVELGVVKGDRLAILVPPGIDLAVSIFAAWRVGAVVVLVDAGLGIRGIGHALASANPGYLVGIPKALLAARTLQWPGVRTSTQQLRERGEGVQLPERPGALDVAGIGFTSGATGPAKGVVYRHHQLQAQRDAIRSLYEIGSSDSLVAAFGPFALFGPLIGIPSVVPDMELTSPGTLTAAALADAAAAVDATLVFGSPAALRNVIATAGDLSDDQRTALEHARLLLSAGAPVNVEILREAAALMPNAEAHTPYGMTEAMPVADIDLEGIVDAGNRSGVCVGVPVEGVEVAIAAIDSNGRAVGALTSEAGVVGEVCIRAPHMRDGYDKLWVTQDMASQPVGWHRSGDVGHLDDEGRLWVEGRIGHVVTTAAGPVTPIGIEHAVELLDGVALAAMVGVGPVGTQQIVVVLALVDGVRSPGLASESLADQVRGLGGAVDIAAVFTVPELPVDKRHNSKIDRGRIALWAEAVLAGGRLGRL
jgi:acyl-coenzyme A synthetase/AMP-(fatty) acid ligase/pimeloyl-ACP methyl ester carboxylesterase